jgi:hypothetical protein
MNTPMQHVLGMLLLGEHSGMRADYFKISAHQTIEYEILRDFRYLLCSRHSDSYQ